MNSYMIKTTTHEFIVEADSFSDAESTALQIISTETSPESGDITSITIMP